MKKKILSCYFEPSGSDCECVNCGKRVTSDNCNGLRSQCKPRRDLSGKEVVHRTKSLGDITEGMLKRIGVTQDRYKAAKELFGLSPSCNCNKRKEWLNSVSDWWMGEKDA
tara:strand:- start:10538 stop:10867 length:330 start_codon:yes stop_codon:yes gene_type:complete